MDAAVHASGKFVPNLLAVLESSLKIAEEEKDQLTGAQQLVINSIKSKQPIDSDQGASFIAKMTAIVDSEGGVLL